MSKNTYLYREKNIERLHDRIVFFLYLSIKFNSGALKKTKNLALCGGG